MALMQVAELLEAIDAGVVSEMEKDALLFGAGNDLSASVDRRMYLIDVLSGGDLSVDKDTKGLIGSANEKIKMWQARKETLVNTLERIKSTTLSALQASEFKVAHGSELGFKIAVNPPSLKLTMTPDKKSFTNIVCDADIDFYTIPKKYLTLNSFFTLNTQTIKNDLDAGSTLPWATLERGERIKVTPKMGNV